MPVFDAQDIAQLNERGIDIDDAARQFDRLTKARRFVPLDRPCTRGDGIRVLSGPEIDTALRFHEEACRAGRIVKFVPASGAASRMFQVLLRLRGGEGAFCRDRIRREAAAGDAAAKEVLDFMDGVRRFAFFPELAAAMEGRGLDAAALARQGEFGRIVEFLLTACGLDYAAFPKGLLPFHRYGASSRTAFEEHLVEATHYVRDEEGICRLHFTLAPLYRRRFSRAFDRVRERYERSLQVRYEVAFSVQKPSTSTIALDDDGRPFRADDDRLLLRPGGHGALIENLDELRGDIVSIKNIDNVVPERLLEPVVRWKKILAGVLISIQHQIFRFMEQLTQSSPSGALLAEAMDFARERLCLFVPPAVDAGDDEAKRRFLRARFNRPLRVCGMVPNAGETGGGPFWVRGLHGELSLQIVESAEVDPDSASQRDIMCAATHFNPVDLVCGVRDWRGRGFSLRDYVNRDAVFITAKSEGGRSLKAIERPGLWNGGMADWTTVFVEVPLVTFHPVKTVNDLLRPEHQAEVDGELLNRRGLRASAAQKRDRADRT